MAKITNDNNLEIVKWAEDLGTHEGMQHLAISLDARKHTMHDSPATGEGLVTNGHVGADVIRLKANDKFTPHTHPGDHLLIIIGGKGTITYDGRIYPTKAGDIYMIDGKIPHAVGAITDHVIMAVGSPHKTVDSPFRMHLVEYRDVASKIGDMHCLICDIKAKYPTMLHENGCKHCPCDKC